MPHSMPWEGQKDKWFAYIIFIGLPFYILYKVVSKDLPPLSSVGPKYY